MEMCDGPKPCPSGHKASQTHQQALMHCFLRLLWQKQAQFCFSPLFLPWNDALYGPFAYHQNIESSINVEWNHLPLPSAIPPSLPGNILLVKRNGTQPIVLCSQLIATITASFGEMCPLPRPLPVVTGLCSIILNLMFTACCYNHSDYFLNLFYNVKHICSWFNKHLYLLNTNIGANSYL